MFICQRCKKVSQPREKQHRKVVETRLVMHRDEIVDPESHKRRTTETRGSQIVKEIVLCGTCAMEVQ